MTMREIAAAARKKGMEFVLLTPHLWESTWDHPRRRARWQGLWRAMADKARAIPGITMIPGVEFGLEGIGHFLVAGPALDTVQAVEFLDGADAAGAFIAVAHPFVVPTRREGVRVSFRDMSYRPWTDPRKAEHVDPIDGVEVWNVLHRSSRLVSPKAEDRGFVAADRLARAQRRPIAVVGGTDNHKKRVFPTTWVLATDASEAAILDALARGATCVGGIEAALEAHGDADLPDRWAVIGETVHARARVELRWTGEARLFVDGVDRGVHEGGWVHDAAAGVHTYRIERARSKCGFVYANLTD
jgi:hypothetical protein